MPQTLARSVTHIGTIRIGKRVPITGGQHAGQPRPERLKHFRITSNSRAALELVARHYGGTVQAWTVPDEWRDFGAAPTHSWEVFTTSEVLNILFHPDGVMDTSWEEWQGGLCALRCNGQFIVKDGTGKGRKGEPCRCPSDPQERKRLAAKKPPEACEEISRIAVFLEGVPALLWRMSTKGFYAPAELRGLQDIMRACEVADMLVRAQMRLEWRTDKKLEDGKPATLIYPVVVIEPRQSADELLAIGEERRQRQLHPATERKQLAEHITDLSEPVDATASVEVVMRPSGPGGVGRPWVAPAPGTHGRAAGETVFDYMAQIEAAILAQPAGSIERSRRWAEKQFEKAQQDFTVDDYRAWLAKVREVAQERAARSAQKPQEGTQGASSAQDVPEGVPGGKTPGEAPTSPAGASGEAGSAELFPQEHRADDYGPA